MLRSYLNLGSWLWAHITVFSGLFLGLRTDPESTKGGAIDVEGADPYRVIVGTCILRTLLQIQGYSFQNQSQSQCSVAVAPMYSICQNKLFLYFCKGPKGKQQGKQPSTKHATSTQLSILSRLVLSPARKRQSKTSIYGRTPSLFGLSDSESFPWP